MNPLFERLNAGRANQQPTQNNQNILSQFAQLQRNPGAILDILLRNGKINQMQYNDLQQYRNSPEQIFNYLVNCGNGKELNQIKNQLGK